jgi:hypothetical protein
MTELRLSRGESDRGTSRGGGNPRSREERMQCEQRDCRAEDRAGDGETEAITVLCYRDHQHWAGFGGLASPAVECWGPWRRL